MGFYVYIIQSLKDESFYIGSTAGLEKRLAEHNSGRSTYTSAKMPWKLVYIEQYEAGTDAMKREAFLKRQRNRNFYQRLADSQK
jgi:putative endonuclease